VDCGVSLGLLAKLKYRRRALPRETGAIVHLPPPVAALGIIGLVASCLPVIGIADDRR